MTTMRKTLCLAGAAVLSLFVLVGCGSDNGQPEPKKEDFNKSGPPPQWRGPGQPGGPESGKPSGPPPGSGPIAVPDKIKNGGR